MHVLTYEVAHCKTETLYLRNNLHLNRGGHDHMVVGFTTTFAISAYHHWCCDYSGLKGIGHRILSFGIFVIVCLMVFNATFNNISVISWPSVLLVEEIDPPFLIICFHLPVGRYLVKILYPDFFNDCSIGSRKCWLSASLLLSLVFCSTTKNHNPPCKLNGRSATITPIQKTSS
jgi:hypothetical protein